jgi:hypothetical protein
VRPVFDQNQQDQLRRAAEVSEDAVADHFHLSSSHWERHGLELVSGTDLAPDEVVAGAFAQVLCYQVHQGGVRPHDLYRICVQDHNILSALDLESVDILFPLLVYVLTHELIHVVRFTSYQQLYVADEGRRAAEESRVHEVTHDLLKERRLKNLELVLACYERHRRAHLPPRLIRFS